MVAIVAGNGLGLFNTSLNTLGGAGTFGQDGSLGQAGGSAYVNVATGNLILQYTDEQMSGLGDDLYQLRTYNTRGLYNDGDGDGWRWEGERKLVLSGTANAAGSMVTRTTGDGHEAVYTWSGSNYVSLAGGGAQDVLVYSSSLFGSGWTWTDGSTGLVEKYNAASGRLTSATNTDGTSITYAYDASGRLTSVKDSSGQELVLVYTAGGKLERLDTRTTAGSLLAPAVLTRQVYYGYDANGRLEAVSVDLTPADGAITDNNVYKTTYTYDAGSQRVASVTQSDGTTVSYTYVQVGSEYRIASMTDASGTTTFTYDTVSRRTDVTNALGQQWSYLYDAGSQLTQVLTPAVNGQRLSTSYTYDASGNVSSVTDGRGNTVSYGYDVKGNRTLERDALGNTITRSYNATNQVLNEVRYTVPATFSGGVWTNPADSNAVVTRYVYDAATTPRLRYVVGGTGQVTEYRYNGSGLRYQEVTYPAANYSVSGLASTATLTEAQLNTWVGSQDKTKTTLTELVYDYRGNVSKSTTYNTVGSGFLGANVVDAAAIVTEYIYSENGQLLKTIAVRGSGRTTKADQVVYTYDGMGRVLTQTDANGTQTYSYDGANRKVVTTNTAGLTTTQIFDARGRLVSVSAVGADGHSSITTRTTQYVYDANGRQTMVQDATGVRTYTFYDEAGRVSARVDGMGAVTEYVYSATGQLTQEKRYATLVDTTSWYDGSVVTRTLVSQIRPAAGADRATTYAYDNAGRLSSQTDAIGTATTFTYDARGLLLQRQTGDRVLRYFYDAAGRQLAQLDGEGYLREQGYDAAGRLVRVTRYEQVTNASLRVTGTLDQLRPGTGSNLETWYFYDGAGRQIGSVDEQQYVTETVFDEALNTQQSIRYAVAYTTAITSTTTFATIRSAVTSTAKQTTTTAFDSYGRVGQRTANDGTITAYEYDTAGRLVKEAQAQGSTEERSTRLRYDAFGQTIGKLLGEASTRITTGMTEGQIMAVYADYGLTYKYDAAGRSVSVTDANGIKVVSYYDQAGRLTHVVNALGEVDETLYSAFGDISERTALSARLSNPGSLTGGLNTSLKPLVAAIKNAANDNKTGYSYDLRGLLTAQTDAMGWLTSSTYNGFGELATLTRTIAAGVTVGESYAYNKRGERLSRTEDTSGLNRLTSTTYDAFGRIKTQVDGRGLTTTTSYDLNGRKITVSNPLNQTQVNEYDAWGRTFKTTDALGKVTTFSYDDVSRKLTVGYPDGASVVTERNRHGETFKVTDGRGNTTTYTYTRDGQLDTVVNALSQTTTDNTYDDAGNLVSSKDALNNITGYGYDAANRRVTRTDALGTITSYAFDGQGRQVTVTEAMGRSEQRVTEYAYDRNGRTLTVTQDPAGLALRMTYVYDGVGQQVQVSQGTVASPNQRITLYTFDKLGRRISERLDPSGLNITKQYKYNGNDQVTRQINALGNSTWYVYDNAGRLTDTIDALGAVTRNVHDDNGRVISTTRYATAVSTAGFGDAVTTVSPSADAARDQSTSYVYDDMGRVLSTTDALGYTESYTYDLVGNRKTLTNKKGAVWNYNYDALNRLSEEITPQVSASSIAGDGSVSSVDRYLVTTISYDALGNVKARSEGRLRDAVNDAASADDLTQARTTGYDYDALGRQIRITSPGWYNKATGQYQQASDGTSNTFQVTTDVLYDALGNAVRNRVYVNKIGSFLDYIDSFKVYDAVGRTLFEVDALKSVTAYGYDAQSNQTVIKRYANPLTSALPASGYYSSADITATSLAPDATQDRTVVMTYDAAGRKTSAQQSLVWLYTYTSPGATAYQASPVTLYSYDALGQLTRETQIARSVSGTTVATGASTYHYYDAVGRNVGTVDALGYTTAQEYDALGQLQRTIEYKTALSSWSEGGVPGAPVAHADDRRTVYSYDLMGRVTQIALEGAAYWKRTLIENYSTGSLAMTQQTGLLVAGKMTYDRLGNVIEQRDAADNLMQYEYNALGVMTRATEPVRATATAGRLNPFENNTAYYSLGAPVTTYAVNAFGQVVSETGTPGAGQAGWAQTSKTRYDAVGHVIQQVDAANAAVNYKVDTAGRRIESTQQVSAQFGVWSGVSGYSQTLRQTYEYDVLGQQKATYDWYVAPDGNTGFTGKLAYYNRFGEVSSEYSRGGVGATSTMAVVAFYTYDQAGRVVQQQSAQGINKVEYDLAGHATRSTQVGDGSAANPDRITRTVYDAAGRATFQYLPTFTINLASQSGATANTLTSTTLSLSTPVIQQTYDRWGNVLTRTDARGYSTSYTYDHANHLLTETLPQTDILREDGTSYRASLIHEKRYDALGNVLQELDWVGPYAGMATSTLLRTRAHAYNAVGQLTRDVDALGVSRFYMVDSDGNRVATRDGVGTVLIDNYDVMGRQIRHGIIRGATGSQYMATLQSSLYDQAGRKYAEIDGAAEVQDAFVNPSYLNPMGTASYSVFDERGNVVRTRNQSGVERSYVFNHMNHKVRETDALSNSQTWAYDYTDYGRQYIYVDLGGRQYNYHYNVFGQMQREALRGVSALDKTYSYYENGLLKSLTEGVQSYDASGVIVKLQERRTSTYEYDSAGNRVREIDSVQTFLPATPTTIRQSASAETRFRFDEQGRLAGMYVPASQTRLVGVANSSQNYSAASVARIDVLKYDFDELGNRRRTTLNTTSAAGPTLRENWFAYDREGRVLVGEGFRSSYDAKLVAGWLASGQTQGYLNSYNAAGQLVSTITPKGRGDFIYDGTTYTGSRNIFDEQIFEYDDLGHLKKITGHYLGQIDNTNSSEPLKLVSSVRGSGITGGTTWVANNDQVRLFAAYNDKGGLESQTTRSFKANGALDTHTYSLYNYRGDGRLVYSVSNNQITGDKQYTYYNDAGMMDAEGNQLAYRVEINKASGTGSYVNNYTKTYARYDGYKEATILVTTTQSGYTSKTTTNLYTERGEIRQSSAPGTGGFTSQYASNAEGLLVARREQSGKVQGYVYYQRGEVATVGNASTAELSDTYTPVSINYTGTSASTYQVGQSDTLAGIAQLVWGDARMWYLIADANGLSQGANDPLTAGETLKIPRVVGSSHNDAATFKPYDPGEVIGDTTPSPTPPPPPKPKKKKCGGLAKVIMAVVAVVAVVVTAGAAAVAMGAVASGTSFFAAGAAALAGGSAAGVSMGVGYAIGAAVIGGAVGSAAGQLAGMAMGVVDSFSWRQVAMGGLAAGLSSGAGGAGLFAKAGQGMSWGNVAAYANNAVVSYGVNQLSGRIAGLDTSFSWRGVAASVAGSVAGGVANNALGIANTGGMWAGVARSMVGGAAHGYFNQQWARGGKIDFVQLAMDSFGNALGNDIVDKMTPSESTTGARLLKALQSQANMTEAERAQVEARLRAMGDATFTRQDGDWADQDGNPINGAYGRETGKILISGQLLDAAVNDPHAAATLQRVLYEEQGHRVASVLEDIRGVRDLAGDEGTLVARTLMLEDIGQATSGSFERNVSLSIGGQDLSFRTDAGYLAVASLELFDANYLAADRQSGRYEFSTGGKVFSTLLGAAGKAYTSLDIAPLKAFQEDVQSRLASYANAPGTSDAARLGAQVLSFAAGMIPTNVTEVIPIGKVAGKVFGAIGDGVRAARSMAGPVFKDTKEATKAAEAMGYKRVNENIKGQAVYRKGNEYITRDVDGHNGGAWKVADSIKDLGSKSTRGGTYNSDLSKRIGD